MFANCIICESLKDLISKLGMNSNEALGYEANIRKYILHKESCINLYHTWRIELVRSKDEFPYIIHEKMDHAKTAFPRLQLCNKMIFRLGQLPITLMGMITHGHKDERYAQYFNELWPNNPNFTIGSLLQFFQTLEAALVNLELKLLFEHPSHNSFFARLLQGKSCCIHALCSTNQIVGVKPL